MDPQLLLGLAAGTALAALMLRTLSREIRRRNQNTAPDGLSSSKNPSANDSASGAESHGQSADHEPEDPSVLNGFELESEVELETRIVNGWTVRCGERRFVRLPGSVHVDPWATPLVRRGFVALCAKDLPEAFRVPWRMPSPNNLTAAAKMVRGLWADLSLHLDDRVGIQLGGPLEGSPEAVLAAARRLVAGVHAVAQSEADLMYWLLCPDGDEAPGSKSFTGHLWRVDLLLQWFPEHLYARTAAQSARSSTDLSMRVKVGIFLSDRQLLIETARSPEVTPEVKARAAVHGAALAFAAADFDWLAQVLTVTRKDIAITADVARILLDSNEKQAIPCLAQAFTVLVDHESVAVALFKRIEWLGGSPQAREQALASTVAEVRSRATTAVLRDLGEIHTSAVCMAHLVRITTSYRGGKGVFRNAEVAISLLERVTAGGTAEDLPHLKLWINARDWDWRPLEDVRDAVEAAIAAIRARQPKELVGGLSMIEGETGGLSPEDDPSQTRPKT